MTEHDHPLQSGAGVCIATLEGVACANHPTPASLPFELPSPMTAIGGEGHSDYDF